jgi:preprotein translocase subunit SecD
LSIGMGVDANVLIFERVKEELQLKKWIHQSIIDGCEKSWSAIRDGNATTFMIAILLFFMGTNVFKGFGTMMMVNIILTLMVIVPLTQQLLLVFFQEEK